MDDNFLNQAMAAVEKYGCTSENSSEMWTKNSSILERHLSCNGTYDYCHDICYERYVLQSFDEMWPPQYAHPIYGMIFPFLVFLTLICNMFVVLVLSRKHMATPTNLVLLYMAIADLFVGVVPFPFTFFYYTVRYFERQEQMEVWWCKMAHYLMDALPPICHNIAIWLTVLLAFQRYIYIRYPVTAQFLCTRRNVHWAALVIIVVSTMCGIGKAFEADFEVFRGYEINSSWTTGCLFRLTPFVQQMGEDLFYCLYFWTRGILFVWVPSVLLIVFNALLMYRVHEADLRRCRLTRKASLREMKKQLDNNMTSLMLILIVTLFLIVNLPQGIYIVLLCISESFHVGLNMFNTPYSSLFLMIDNMLILATYPVNFFIYCSMSSVFRMTFKNMLCHAKGLAYSQIPAKISNFVNKADPNLELLNRDSH